MSNHENETLENEELSAKELLSELGYGEDKIDDLLTNKIVE